MNLVHGADSVKLVDYIPIRGGGGGGPILKEKI